MKAKKIPARYMRGYDGLTKWVVLVATGIGKKWDPHPQMGATSAIIVFLSLVSMHKRWGIDTSRQPWPIRLIGPGGVIAAEKFVRRPTSATKRASHLAHTGELRDFRRGLVSTERLRSSIVAPPAPRIFYLQDAK
jgi:hypothetical protein